MEINFDFYDNFKNIREAENEINILRLALILASLDLKRTKYKLFNVKKIYELFYNESIEKLKENTNDWQIKENDRGTKAFSVWLHSQKSSREIKERKQTKHTAK